MANFRWLPLITALLLAQVSLRAAAPAAELPNRSYAVRVWETDDGLPNDSVLSMVQTRDGYLWLGTLNGLVRFDGVAFKLFQTGNTPGLPENRIVYLFEDSRERLWIGTENFGVVFMQNGKVIAVPALANAGPDRRLQGACEDSAGGFCKKACPFWRL